MWKDIYHQDFFFFYSFFYSRVHIDDGSKVRFWVTTLQYADLRGSVHCQSGRAGSASSRRAWWAWPGRPAPRATWTPSSGSPWTTTWRTRWWCSPDKQTERWSCANIFFSPKILLQTSQVWVKNLVLNSNSWQFNTRLTLSKTLC